MTREENIKAILECNFAGYKEEIIENAVKRICDLKEEPKEDYITIPNKATFDKADYVRNYCQYKRLKKRMGYGNHISRAKAQTEIMMFADNKKIDDDIYIKVSDAVELLRELPSAQTKQEWIPVSERLPEDGERVLVTYDKIVIRATWDLMRYSFYDTHAVSLDKDFVYAWMPLPEPYKESEE